MRALHVGLGAMAGAAVALAVVNSLYPDVSRRMTRDGRRFIRSTRRSICDLGNMMQK